MTRKFSNAIIMKLTAKMLERVSGKKNKKSSIIIISIIAIGLAFIFTRICLELANQITSSMGVVMNSQKIYVGELYMLILIFIASLLPTTLGLFRILRRDLGDEK